MQKELTAQQRAHKKYNDNLKSTHRHIWLDNESHALISTKAKQNNIALKYALAIAISQYVKGDK